VFNALSAGGSDSKLSDYFSSVEDQLRQRATEYSRMAYVGGGTIPGSLLLIVSFIAILYGQLSFTGIRLFFIGFFGGAVGAIISVLIRSDTLRVDPYAHRYFVAFQGLTRILLGVLFGFLLIAAVKGRLVGDAFAGNNYALFILSAVSGYSEKFIPELMSKIETQGLRATNTAKEASRNVS
jgi:hypothetical protein